VREEREASALGRQWLDQPSLIERSGAHRNIHFKVHHHVFHACQLGQTHIWVDLYQFVSNRVSLGRNRTGFRPGLCGGCPSPYIYTLLPQMGF
jgi:hypothetical protein